MNSTLLPSTTPLLSPLERLVVDLSRRDPPASLRRRRSIAALIFGQPEVLPLANTRLEALRRYAVLRRRAPDAIAEERKRLGEIGFAPQQIDAVDRLIDRGTARRSLIPASATTGECMQHRPSWFTPIVGIGLFIPMSLIAGTAHSQTQPPIEDPVETPAKVPETDGPPPGGPPDENRIAIGVGAAYMPAYHGSNKYRVQPLPALDIKLGRFFVNFQDGIGANLIDTKTFTIGAGVVMADNYRAKDAPRGIGKLPFGAGARGFVKTRLAGFEATVGGTQIFAGSTKGFVVDASISRPIMVSEKLFLNPSIGTTWANAKHLNRYFGVNARQSLASGLPQYRLASGIMDVKAELGLQYRLTDKIGIGLVGGYSSLMGDAKDSPIVRKRSRPYGIAFVSYSF